MSNLKYKSVYSTPDPKMGFRSEKWLYHLTS